MNFERLLHEIDAQSPPPPGDAVTAARLALRLRRRRARAAVAIVLLAAPLAWLCVPGPVAAAPGVQFDAPPHLRAVAARAALAGWASVSLLEQSEPGRAAELRAQLLQDPLAASTRALLPDGHFPTLENRR